MPTYQTSRSLDEVDTVPLTYQVSDFGDRVAGDFPMAADGVLADLDFDFQNGRYYQSGQGVDPLVLTTTSRASTAYADNLAGTWSAFFSNVPRITNKGLLVEEARTNSIRNNSMQDAAAPSTFPTNWLTAYSANQGTLAATVVSVGTLNGQDIIEVRLAGTPAGAGQLQIQPESKTQIVASSGQTWTASVFGYRSAGSTTNISSINLSAVGYTAAGAFTESATSAANILGGLALFGISRGITTKTFAVGTTARVSSRIDINYTAAVATDITVIIGWNQIELGAFATSPIRTTTAAATRAADVVTVTTVPAFGSAYTLFNKATPNAPVTYATNQVSLGVNDGTANERSRTQRVATTGVGQGVTTTGGVDTVVASGMVSTQGSSRRIAFAVANVDQAVSQNASAIVTGAGALPSTPTVITVGTDQSTTLQYDGYIERIALWASTRLSNGSLQRITQ